MNSFLYENYFIETVAMPLFGLVLSACVLFAIMLQCVREWRKVRSVTSVHIAKILLALFVVLNVWPPNIQYLKYGGVQILQDYRKDPSVIVGTIESICEPSAKLPLYKIGQHHGADIAIDGEAFFVETCSGFSIGDVVTVTYLPSSHFILSIALESTQQQP